MHVYSSPTEALHGLVKIFGPITLLELLGEFRSLIRAKQVANIPYSWTQHPKGFSKEGVKKILEELWLAGEIIQVADYWKAR